MMSNVQRVCVQCGEGNPVESRYCGRCGYDSQSALPAQRPNLPVVIGRAALPVLLGAASLALRMGWKLLQNRLAQPPAPAPAKAPPPTVHFPNAPLSHPGVEVVQPRRANRTI